MSLYRFRAKHAETGEWVQGYGAATFNPLGAKGMTGMLGIQHDMPFLMPVDPRTVGICTEMLDRGKVPIYEGDVVRWMKTLANGQRCWMVGVVAYHSDQALFEVRYDIKRNSHGVESLHEGWRVIGNLYDNPELRGKVYIEGACRVCGCTEDRACPGGCAWVDAGQTLCSSCDRRV